jgi:hypothetical protein
MQYKFIATNAYLSKVIRSDKAAVTKQDNFFVVWIKIIYSRNIILTFKDSRDLVDEEQIRRLYQRSWIQGLPKSLVEIALYEP